MGKKKKKSHNFNKEGGKREQGKSTAMMSNSLGLQEIYFYLLTGTYFSQMREKIFWPRR